MEAKTFICDKTIRHKEILSLTIAFMVSFLALLNCINAITNLIGFNNSLDTIACYGILIILILLSIFSILKFKKIKYDIIIIIIFLVLSFALTYIFCTKNVKYMFTSLTDYATNPIYLIFLYSLPGYFVVRYIDDFSSVDKYLKPLSYIVVIMSVIIYFFASTSEANQYMTLSYNMLLQLVYLLMFPPNKNKLLHYIVVLLGIIVLVIGGARGAVASLMLTFILFVLFKKMKLKKKLNVILICLILLIALSIFYRDLLLIIQKQLILNGIESRTITMLIEGTSDFSSGRFEIIEVLFDNLSFFGEGLYGDRVILEITEHKYAHNLFLELIVDFGFLGFLISLLLFLLVKAINNNKNINWKYLIVLIPNGLFALMFSGSYLNQAPCFYILLGLCVNMVIKVKKDESFAN